MTNQELQAIEKRHQDNLIRLRGMRPMDDTFMRCLFKDNVALTELVLRIILNKKDLSVTKIETQADMKRWIFLRRSRQRI